MKLKTEYNFSKAFSIQKVQTVWNFTLHSLDTKVSQLHLSAKNDPLKSKYTFIQSSHPICCIFIDLIMQALCCQQSKKR